MNLFRGRVAVLGFVILVVAAACGPTAQVLHPTLPPRLSSHPVTTPSDTANPNATPGSETPAPPATPPPPGITDPLTSFPSADAFEVTGVAATTDGFEAVGFGDLAGQGYFGLRQGIVWKSADGLSWQESADPAFQDVTPTNIVTLGSDVYVFGMFSTCASALDSECVDDPGAGTVVFRSPNGGPWERLTQTPDIQQAQFDGVRTAANMLVAFGSAADENGTSTLWTSTDGLAWTATTDLAGLDPVSAVAANDAGLVAFGTRYDDTIEDTQLVAATSSDNIHFTAANVPSIPIASVVDMAAGPGGFVGVGYAESDVAPSIGLTVASADGTSWAQTVASDGSFQDSLLTDVHSAANEYVSVGSTLDSNDPTLQTGRIWASADGQRWRSLGDFGGPFSQYGASALGASGLVVFTADQAESENDYDIRSTIYGWFLPTNRLGP